MQKGLVKRSTHKPRFSKRRRINKMLLYYVNPAGLVTHPRMHTAQKARVLLKREQAETKRATDKFNLQRLEPVHADRPILVLLIS